MNTNRTISLLLAGAALLTGCGRADVNSSNPAPTSTDSAATPNPTATASQASWKSGIYVASYDGDDGAVGSPENPMRTISAALVAAREKGVNDVFLFGGGLNGSYQEIVVLQQATSLHGGLCRFAPMVVDTNGCRTTISGGSPAMIVDGVTSPTTVENLAIVGTPAVQNDGTTTTGFFSIPTLGCLGRGKAPSGSGYVSCAGPGVDAQGRTLPQSSMALAMVKSSNVVFRHDDIESGDAANGLAGFDGADGANAPANAGPGGDAPINSTTVGGASGIGGTNPACPEAHGTAGGAGGHFNLVTATVGFAQKTVPTGYSGTDGVSLGSLAGGAGGSFLYRNQYGADGAPGATPTATPAPGDAGHAATNDVDITLLVAGAGSNGEAGLDGFGGTGGGGGAPGTVAISQKVDSSGSQSVNGTWGIFSISGSNGGDSSYSATYDKGETPAGGGGGGGAGGCGGQAGTGGQGGASSVGAYLVDSSASFPQSLIVSGKGGNGGAGGQGGKGGNGATGAKGGQGAQRDAVSESYTTSPDSSGAFSVLNISIGYQQANSQNVTTAKSGSQGGFGGDGAPGQNGSAGGSGAGGAGGASIGVIVKGVGEGDVTQATVELGDAGMGGAPNAVGGKKVEQYDVE